MSKQSLSLKGRTRTEAGRGAAKRARNNGQVPGVLYGKGTSKPVEFDLLAVQGVLSKTESDNAIVNIELEGESGGTHLALLQEVQQDPITDHILHLDLHEVSQNEKIKAEVAVHSVGVAEGVRNGGGLLETMLHTLEVECFPKDLPDYIEANVEHLELEQAVHVNEIKLPEGVIILNNGDLPVFSVSPPRVIAETDAPAAAVAPEVIGAKDPEKAEA